MSKKLIFPKRVKSILALALTCLITITLAGCDSSNRKSTGDLDLKAEYASNGTYTVSVGELYDELRYYASDYVINAAFEVVYDAEIKEVKDNTKKYEEKFNELILTDIYGTDDQKEIDELGDEKETLVLKYKDKMFKEGYNISSTDIAEGKFESVYAYYYLEVAKHVAAWNKLASEFTVTENGIDFGDITEDSHFSINDVVNYYKSNKTNQGYVDALLVRFVSAAESNEVLKKFGIKTENGRWYQIGLDEDSTKWNTNNKYNDYYNDYDVDKQISEHGISQIVDKATIIKIYIALYNYIYTYRTPITGFTSVNFSDIEKNLGENEKHLAYYKYIQAIINEENGKDEAALKTLLLEYDVDNKYIHMSRERLDQYSTSLSTYVYTSLKTASEVEEGEKYTQFTTSAKSYNSYYYMIFKLGQEENVELYEEVEEDGETNYKFLETEEAKALKQEILMELFKEEINETYIHELEHERLEDVKIKIFDSVVESQFMYLSNSELVEGYDKTRKSNNNDIAYVTYKDNERSISVSEVYEFLEPLYGPQTASSLLFDKYIIDQPYYTDLEKDYDEYVETIEMMLYYFANDYYASSGYPSTIGKYNFMKLYFRTANVEEAVRNILMLTDAKSAYISDFTAHGFDTAEDKDFYSLLNTFAAKERSEYYSLTATSLRVYMDKDEDGEDDVLTDAELTEAHAILKDVRNVIATSNEDYASALNSVVTDYNTSSRILPDNNNPTTPEARWAKYRHAGYNLEVVTVGEVNNSTTNADDNIQERIETLYNNKDLINVEYGFSAAYLDKEPVETENSLSLLLITAGTLPTSAKYENEENEDLYKEISVLINDELTKVENIEYTTDEITYKQVKVYVAEYVLFGDVYSLPETTTTALDQYLLPLIQKYTSQAGQSFIISNAVGTITFKTENAARNDFYNEYMMINLRTADNYDVDASWWKAMHNVEVEGGNN